MGINSVHTVLQRLFPKVDPCMLRDAANEESNDVGAAVKVLLDKIISSLHKQSITSLYEYEVLHDCDSGYIQNEVDIQMNPDISSKAMSEKDTLAVEMIDSEDESPLNSITTSTDQICSTELLDAAIEHARKSKETLVLTMESVMNLMREVECKEKAAEQAKEEAARCSLDILAKVDELKQAQRNAKETNDMCARKVYAHKAILASEMKELQHRVSLLDEGDRSLGVLDEIRKALEMRLTAASMKKEEANKEKLEKEISARQALSFQESEMKKVVEESKRLKQESEENDKLQEFLIDRGHVVDKLYGGISVNCHYVNLLKEELDQAGMLSASLSSSHSSSMLASSNSSLTNVDLADSYVDSYETSKESAGLAVFAELQPFSENQTLNLEYQEGNKNRETEKLLRPIQKTLQRRCVEEECEGKKCKNFKKGIKRRIAVGKMKVVRNKRNQSGTKNIKIKEIKRWIFKKGIKRRIAVSKVKVVRNERNQSGTKNIKNEEMKRCIFKKWIKRRIAASKVKVVCNKRNQSGTEKGIKRWIFKKVIKRRYAVGKVKGIRNKRNQSGNYCRSWRR